MPKKVTIKFDNEAFRNILNNSATREYVQYLADGIALQALNLSSRKPEPEYSAKIFHGAYGGGRTIGIVKTENVDAMVCQAVDKSLSKAVGSC